MGTGIMPKLDMAKSECAWLAEQVDTIALFHSRKYTDKSAPTLEFNSPDRKILRRIGSLTGSAISTTGKRNQMRRRIFISGRAKLYIVLTQVLPFLNHREKEASEIVDWILDKGIPDRKPYSAWMEMYLSSGRLT
jgi:hypothetical protein